MNPYLSKEEKARFIRASAVVILIDEAIENYDGVKSIPPEFLKYMRMGRTMINKALEMRSDALEQTAKIDLVKHVSKLEIVFVPTPEAKKAHAELLKMRSIMPMEFSDFEDWYSAVIEVSCKTCYSKRFEECPIRGILAKYGVIPIDPAAVGKCQYSYIGTPEADELPGVAVENVPADVYNAALAVVRAKEDSIENNYLPMIRKLQAEIEQLKAARAEETTAVKEIEQAAALPEAEGLSVIVGLRNGSKIETRMSEYLAINLLTELERPNRIDRALCSCHFGDELISIDMQDVVSVQVIGIEDGVWQTQEYSYRPAPPEYQRPLSDDYEKERFRIECKCGAEYFATMNLGRDKGRCRHCSTTVFADRKADPFVGLDGQLATIMTNRYWVEKEDRHQMAEPVQPQRYSNGKDYVDPLASLVG